MTRNFYLLCTITPLFFVLAGQAQQESTPKELQRLLATTQRDTNRINVLLKLGTYYVSKRGELDIDLDSALVYAEQAIALSRSLQLEKFYCESTLLKSACYFEKGEQQRFREMAMTLIRHYQQTGDKSMEAYVWMRMGSKIRGNIQNYEESISYLRKAQALYKQTGEKEKSIVILKDIADIHLNQSKIEESEKELLEVLEGYRSIGFKNLHYTYDLLTAAATKKGDLNQALVYGFEAVRSMEETGDSVSAATFYYRLGRIYSELGDIDKSIVWYQKSCNKRATPSFFTCMDVAQGMVLLGKPEEALVFIQDLIANFPPANRYEKAYLALTLGNCYVKLQQYNKAEKYYLQMGQDQEILEEPNDFACLLNFTIGSFFLNRQRYQAAEPYLRYILALPPGNATPQQLKDTHLLLFKVDSAAGNYLSAIRHFQQHKILNDSIFTTTKSWQIEELQIQYETKKKEQDLKLLQNTAVLQQSKLQQATLAKNLTFGGGALLLIIMGLLYNRYRLKQRVNRQLELQQIEINQSNQTLQHLLEDKERLLREIHHRVKNNLQIVMSLLNSQAVFLENEGALAAIRDSQQRIHSISMIHQKLHQSNNLAWIDMAVYIRELAEYLQESYNTGKSIRFDLQVNHIELDVTQAVPLGLILNEAISNAIKYAFQGKDTGEIRIEMYEVEDLVSLAIADNGRGIPPGFDPDKSNSLGMSLMKGLSKQLHGRFELVNRDGVAILIVFKKEMDINKPESLAVAI